MKTKREILKTIAEKGFCCNVMCDECPYYNKCTGKASLKYNLTRIGAMAILRMFPEKREFDTSKILTCITADKARIGMRGYFADSLDFLKREFAVNHIHTLYEIQKEDCCRRFTDECEDWALFYPIEEEVEEE